MNPEKVLTVIMMETGFGGYYTISWECTKKQGLELTNVG